MGFRLDNGAMVGPGTLQVVGEIVDGTGSPGAGDEEAASGSGDAG